MHIIKKKSPTDVYAKLYRHFNNDRAKTDKWLMTPNGFMENIVPITLLMDEKRFRDLGEYIDMCIENHCLEF